MNQGGITDFFARRLWWSLMWFMRRGPIKSMRQNWVKWVPEKRRAAAWEHFRSQERWARDYGLTICRVCVLVVILSLSFQFCWFLVTSAIEAKLIPGVEY
jgi:hypothetical protein